MSGNKTRVLVTGGLGNLGSWVTNHFSSSGNYDVTVLSKNDRTLNITHPFKKIFCDITDGKALRECLAGIDPDLIIHLASLNDTFLDDYASRSLLVNSYGTRNLLEACSGKKIRKFIYMSTFHVYGKDGGEISEQDVVAPLNDYAITHYFAEEYVRMFSKKQGLPYVIFRLSNSYGCPRDAQTGKWYLLFNDLCRQAVQQKRIEIKTNGMALRDFVYMADVCMAIESVAGWDELKNEIFNLGSGESLSLAEMAAHIAGAYKEKYGQEIGIIKNDRDVNVYPSVLKFKIGKLKKAIDFRPSFCYREEAKRIFDFVSGQ
ncbi:MAG TPA: NAD(P)-dependent oxidoreductase [Chitinophagaceae bacterium]